MRLPGPINAITAPLLVGVLALIAAAAGIASMPVLDRDEARFAQATAQMIESGNGIEISFLDEPRHKKPVGIHWLQAAAVQLTTGQQAREIWAWRLPSVLGAILAALATYFAGARLFSRSVGLAGASLLAVTVLLGTEGGIAKTDAMLGATAAGSFLALAILRTGPTRTEARLASLLVWFSLGLGVLIKGPVTPMVAGLAVITLFALERRFDWARPLFWWPGPVLAAVLVLPWLIAIQVATGGNFLLEAVGDDIGTKVVTGDEGHGGLPGYHLMLLPVVFLPAIMTLPAGLRESVRHWRKKTAFADAARLLFAFILPAWLAFELLPTKLPHYVLPTYGALAVVAGLGLVRLGRTPALWRWMGAGLGVIGLGVAVPGLIGLASLYGDLSLQAALPVGAAIAVPGVLASLVTGLGRPAMVLTLAVVTGLSFHIGMRGLLSPKADAFYVSVEAAQAALTLRTASVPGAPIVSTFTEPSLVFTLSGEVTLSDPDTLSARPVEPDTPRLYIIDESRWLRAERRQLTPEEAESRRTFLVNLQAEACAATAVDGLNYSRGDDTIVVFIFATGCAQATGPTQTGTLEEAPS
jgi:4-amino-4-deoxy-L-arabinose transferase-like glycosyltransferase